MSTEKKLLIPLKIQEDEKGNQSLALLLPKDFFEDESKKPNWKERLIKLLTHPLTLLLIGALVSSLILPYLTRAWQDHQRELDLKASVINQISLSTATTLSELESIQTKFDYRTESKIHANSTLEEKIYEGFNSKYQEWQINGVVIKSQLELYFPNSNQKNTLADQWSSFHDAITNFYFLSIIPDKEVRIQYSCNIEKYLGQTCKNNNYNALNVGFADKLYGDNFQEMDRGTWYNLYFAFRAQENTLVTNVLNTTIVIRDPCRNFLCNLYNSMVSNVFK